MSSFCPHHNVADICSCQDRRPYPTSLMFWDTLRSGKGERFHIGSMWSRYGYNNVPYTAKQPPSVLVLLFHTAIHWDKANMNQFSSLGVFHSSTWDFTSLSIIFCTFASYPSLCEQPYVTHEPSHSPTYVPSVHERRQLEPIWITTPERHFWAFGTWNSR